MYLHSISSSFPPYEIGQREGWEMARGAPRVTALNSRSRLVLQKVLTGDSGIDTRRFSVADPVSLFDLDAGQLNDLFEKEAPRLAGSSLRGAMEKADLKPEEIDALLVCTCTGYLCPGVSSHVAEQLGMRNDIYLQDIVGLGCGAAIPTLRSAEGFLATHPDANVAVIAVEVCSSAFFIDNDVGVLVSLCLFGDGASASIWKGTPGPSRYRAGQFDTLHLPEDREKIRFVNDHGKLRNKLHRCVPDLAAAAVKRLYAMRTAEVPYVITHTGGRDVIEAIEAECGLGSIEESREVLRKYGNTSSPSVLLALERYIEKDNLSDHLWLSSFGAGFACHSFELNRQ